MKEKSSDMKFLKNKDELIEWIKELDGNMYGVYVGCDGGGVCFFGGVDDMKNLIEDVSSDRYESVTILPKGEEMEDFKDIMSEEEYNNTDYFIRVNCNYDEYGNIGDYCIQHYEL